MEIKTQDEKTIRRYLLGQASAQEQGEFELWLMAEEDAYDLVVAAEDDLIDDSLAGKLNGDELAQFSSHFLAAPERQRKLEFSRALQKQIKTASANSARAAQPGSVSVSFWAALSEFLRYRPKWSFALTSLILLCVAGGILSSLKLFDLQRKFASSTAGLSEVNRQLETIQSQLRESRAQNERLVSEAQANGNSRLPASPVGALVQVAAVYLKPSAPIRSEEALVTIEISGDNQVVPFQMALPPDDGYVRYRVALLNDGGTVLRTWNNQVAHTTGIAKELILIAPGAILPDGDLRLSLTGISDSPSPEPITYSFRIHR